MFVVRSLPEADYAVEFEHRWKVDGQFKDPSTGIMTEIKHPEGTSCRVFKGSKGTSPKEMNEPVAEVNLKLHHNDKFNKAVGRKYSLAKVLNTAFPGYENKSVRKEFWNSYFSKKNIAKLISEQNKNDPE